jgi:hypothetical protein
MEHSVKVEGGRSTGNERKKGDEGDRLMRSRDWARKGESKYKTLDVVAETAR